METPFTNFSRHAVEQASVGWDRASKRASERMNRLSHPCLSFPTLFPSLMTSLTLNQPQSLGQATAVAGIYVHKLEPLRVLELNRKGSNEKKL